MKNSIITVLCTLFFSTLHAQVKGIVYGSNEKDKKPVYGAKIKLLQANRGVVSDEEGKFEIVLPKELPDTLVISAIGFHSDTIVVDKKDRFISFEVILYSEQLLPEVLVSIKRSTHSVSRLKILQVEEISSGELRKAACCNLSESFETNVSVDVNMTDAVSGAKKIQMMGLDGVYTQLQMENIPYLRGLESAFGLMSMPGTWIESIQITKGTGNVVNGYESMAGLVNMELKKPQEMEKLYLNLYASGMGRTELNFNSGFKLSKKWSSGWFAHGSAHPLEMDYNNDGFRDMPNGYNAAVLNRYSFQGEKMEAQLGINAYIDLKEGGQISSLRTSPYGFYNVVLDSRHIDAFAKTGFFLKKPGHSIGVVYNAKYQMVDAVFGNRTFYGEELRGYINAILDGYFGTTIHKYKFGISGVYSDINQKLPYDYLENNRIELVPGVFGEYTYSGVRLSSVLGVRADYHNLFGVQVSPRAHFKYLLTEYTDLRITGGKGWRVPNYMIDNISLLASNEQWIAPDTIVPEVSWNFGGSVNHHFKIFKREAKISVDFYHTLFENQLIVDRDMGNHTVVFTNLSEGSFSNSLQTEFSFYPFKQLEVRLAYKYLDVRARYAGKLQQQVMIPKDRGFLNLGYITRSKRWEFDFTASVFGESRLHSVMLEDHSYSTDNRSEAYPMLNAQITHVYKKWDFYLGGENLLNYTQKDPIISAEDPFGMSFNATRIWAPVYGVNVYLGIRYAIKQKVNN